MGQYLGRLGTFVRVMYPTGTLARSPHLEEKRVQSYEDYDPEYYQWLKTFRKEKDFKTEIKQHFEKYYSEKDKSEFKIKRITQRPCCEAGENFVSDVIQITIIGYYSHVQDKLDIEKNVMIKSLPPINSPRHSLLDLHKLHHNEIIAYEKVLPTFQKLAQKHNLNMCFPEYHGRGDDFLVLEDLKVLNYRMVDRTQGLNFKECTMVLRELALFHAISFALKKEDIFRENVSQLQESVYCPEFVDGILGVIWENSLKFATKSLETSSDERLIRTGKKLKNYSGSVLNHLSEITKPSDGYGVICHGDLWSNNVMIRYEDDGGRSPISVKLLDLQAFRHSSCVLDVMHLIFTSTKPGTCKVHLYDLLKIYFDSLESVLEILRKGVDFTFEDLKEEFKGKISYGLLVSFLMFTVVTVKSGEMKMDSPLSKEDLSSESVFLKMYGELNSDYHQRTRGLVSALLDLKLLSFS